VDRFFGGFLPWVYRDIPLSRASSGNRLDSYRAAAESDAQSTPTFRYWPGTGGRISYDKTALWLHTLERHLGWPVLQRILATFFERWKFRHPRPADFFAVANEVSGTDLKWFFDQVHRGSNVFDYGIQDLTSRPVDLRGYVEGEGGLTFRQSGRSEAIRTTVVVRRYGEAVFPVELLVTFEDGDRVRERWDGRDRWRLFTYDRPVGAASAQIDPERVLLLDVGYTNNSHSLTPQGQAAARKWMLKWLGWLQDVMLVYAFFV
jgi:hypothetical protein